MQNASGVTSKSVISSRMELPRLTKYLVIASYLASYNPPRLDARFFTRGGEGREKVGRKGGVLNGSKARQQLIGPKIFPLERMLAIFYSICDDDIKFTFDIHTQVFMFNHKISNCISLKLILRMTPMAQLDSIKCKSNVSFPIVKEIGQSINFDVAKYLFDFVDV